MFIWLRRDDVRPIITCEYPCIITVKNKIVSFHKYVSKYLHNTNVNYEDDINY
jgi:hypothetical protein